MCGALRLFLKDTNVCVRKLFSRHAKGVALLGFSWPCTGLSGPSHVKAAAVVAGRKIRTVAKAICLAVCPCIRLQIKNQTIPCAPYRYTRLHAKQPYSSYVSPCSVRLSTGLSWRGSVFFRGAGRVMLVPPIVVRHDNFHTVAPWSDQCASGTPRKKRKCFMFFSFAQVTGSARKVPGFSAACQTSRRSANSLCQYMTTDDYD